MRTEEIMQEEIKTVLLATAAPALPPEPRRPARKVLFLMDNLLGLGGAETAVQRMVTHLPKYGYECHIGAMAVAMHIPELIAAFPCPIHDFTTRRIYDWQGWKTTQRIHDLVVKEQFDIIHTMFPASDLWAGPLARRGTKARIVSGRRDLGIVRNKKHDVLYRWLRGQFDQVQAVSDAARQVSIDKDGVAPERAFTVHNGVDLDEINAVQPLTNMRETYDLSPNGPIIISATGQLWPVKGTDVLIKSAAIVCQKIPDANFLIFGWSGNHYGEEMIRFVRSLNLQNNVKIVGRIRPIAAAFKASDIMCQVSRSEGMSNALLEAMACGLPAVATSVGGNPEVVADGKTGFLVANEDSNAIASRIVEMVQNPQMRLEMGRKSLERIREHFTVDSMVRTAAHLYDRLLDSPLV